MLGRAHSVKCVGKRSCRVRGGGLPRSKKLDASGCYCAFCSVEAVSGGLSSVFVQLLSGS